MNVHVLEPSADNRREELQKEYDQMMEDVCPATRAKIEATGPISDDWFYATRQKKYRELAALSGVIISNEVGGINYHPV